MSDIQVYFASSFLRMRRSSINVSALVVQRTLPKRIITIPSIVEAPWFVAA